MRRLSIVAYIADAFLLGTYAIAAVRPERLVLFHAANAIGCIPLLAVEVKTKAYPVIPLTATFGVLGAVGVINYL